ncbi:hypothetical protein IP91_02573 [Pseudoduganella lurida]|uniref:Uncharacterized protein n=1 Tax=Pseudoduganella lurida TaxID=1036180 RepID=A0A562R9V8_9BURK|nr:hypothetical protein [Pseudoduganella lurida]TWI65166.1 hypothetical protein IP91_02573 [Pseudoduganella lurida]
MRVIPPIEITESMLVYSSVIEAPPAKYDGTTQYALDVTVCQGVLGGVLAVYRSLRAANKGHTPEASPDWWQYIGDTYGAYAAGTAYSKGHRVIDPVAHLVYESQMDANTGQPLATGTAWAKVGPTNKFSSFDQLRSTQTVAPIDIVQTVAPGRRVSSIAVIGLDAASVSISVTVDGVEVYAVSVKLSKRKSFGWRDYFYGEFTYRKNVQFFNLPQYRNAHITVTVRKAVGLRKVGGIILGNAVYIGDMQYKARSDDLNFSTITRNRWGDLEMDPQRSVPKLSGQVWFDKQLTDRLLELRQQLSGRPAVWSGLDDFTLDYFEPLFIYGPHKEFSIDLDGPRHGIIDLEVEEM